MKPEKLIEAALAAGQKSLDEASAKQLLSAYGITVPRSAVARDMDDAARIAGTFTPPLVVKVVSQQILHKSDVGGVRLGLKDAAAVRETVLEMAEQPAIKSKGVDGWLVEEMGAAGTEMVVGAFRDPQFGPMIMVGLGGIFVEVIGDVSFRLCPITADDARAMLAELKGNSIIDGVRGGPPLDRQAIVDALVAIGGADGILQRHPEIAEVDLNPVLVSSQGLVAVDARMILASPDRPRNGAQAKAERTAVDAFEPLFKPRTVAVVGASAKGGTALPNTFIRRLRAFGYAGSIYPIHPTATEIDGLAAFPSLGATPEPVDYAFVGVASEKVPQVLAEARGRARFAQVISSGFSEVEGGAEVERALLDAARFAHVRVVGPNCLGTYSPRGRLTFSEGAPEEAGSIGIVSQSGGLTTNIIQRGAMKGLRFSAAVSAGNCADVSMVELTDFFLADTETRAIGLYVEDIKQGQAFFDLLRTTAQKKPVVVLRGGRSRQGRIAAASHTGALAGDSRAWDALSRQVVMVETETLDEFLDTLLALQELELRPSRPTRRVVMFGNGGGTSVLGADFLAARGLDVSPFAPQLRLQLETLDLLPGSSVANPIDTPVATLQQNGGKVAREIIDIVFDANVTDALLLHLNMSSFKGRGGADPVDDIFRFLGDAMKRHVAPPHVLLAFRTDGDPVLEERKRAFRTTARHIGVPLYDDVPELGRALAAFAHLEARLAASLKVGAPTL